MGAFFSSFDWQHTVLLGGAVLGGVLVGVGILKESEEWTTAAMLVLIGVIMEPIFTIGLFVYDESLSRAQQSTIIALEERLAPRAVSKAEEARLVALLKQFKVEFAMVWYGGEPASFAARLKSILEAAGWTEFTPQYQIMPMAGTVGLQVWGQQEPARGAARALVGALNDIGIAAALFPLQPEDTPNKDKIEIVVGNKN
jgi:hypothetical protein